MEPVSQTQLFFFGHSSLKALRWFVLPESSTTIPPFFDYGFYNLSHGDCPNTTYAIGLYRGDVKPQACHNCLTNSSALSPQQCLNLAQVVGVYDECILNYVDVNLQYGIYGANDRNAPNWDEYDVVLMDLLEKLKAVAASGDSLQKFATRNEKHIHAFVQCDPDLLVTQCKNRLEGAFMYISRCCTGKTGEE